MSFYTIHYHNIMKNWTKNFGLASVSKEQQFDQQLHMFWWYNYYFKSLRNKSGNISYKSSQNAIHGGTSSILVCR